MTKFLNIFKKPCFCPIFGPFFQFLEQKNFSLKFGSVPHNFIWISSNIPNIRKKLMIQFKKKKTPGQKDGRMEDLISEVSSDYRRGSRKIFYLIYIFKGICGTGRKQ